MAKAGKFDTTPGGKPLNPKLKLHTFCLISRVMIIPNIRPCVVEQRIAQTVTHAASIVHRKTGANRCCSWSGGFFPRSFEPGLRCQGRGANACLLGTRSPDCAATGALGARGVATGVFFSQPAFVHGNHFSPHQDFSPSPKGEA